jgi:hypothetical protein
MNYADPILRQIAEFSPLDILLADVAVRIQLTPSDHKKAEGHYHAISEWLERDASELQGLVEIFYPQGGFAIGATTARHADDADFDIDAMVQVNWRPDIDPETALSTLHRSIRGEPGSRYYNKTDRKTRCVTVLYDGMHLDVTPAVRWSGTRDRTSYIFHSKRDRTTNESRRLVANPYGFAEWFILMTPPDAAFGQFFERRSLDFDRALRDSGARADTAPVPDHAPAYRKPRAVIALQLIKRWRNLAYDARHPKLRLPPSVVIAHSVALNANRNTSLSGELQYQVEQLLVGLELAHRRGRTYQAFNPACDGYDELTDRWPGDLSNQKTFIDELKVFAADLRILNHGTNIAEMRKILERLFGEAPARGAVRGYIDRHVQDNDRVGAFHILRSGSVPALGSTAVPAAARPTPKSTPYGD